MLNNLTISDSLIDTEAMLSAGGGCVFQKIVMSLILVANNKLFTDCTADVGHPMPHFPWSLFGYFKSVWIHIAKFITDYKNANIFPTKHPPSELDIKELKNAVIW